MALKRNSRSSRVNQFEWRIVTEGLIGIAVIYFILFSEFSALIPVFLGLALFSFLVRRVWRYIYGNPGVTDSGKPGHMADHRDPAP